MAGLLIEDRPWGRFEVVGLSYPPGLPIAAVKILTVAPNSRLSLQRHEKRHERWCALDAGLLAEVEGIVRPLIPGQPVDVGMGDWHRLSNDSDVPARLVEVMWGKYDEGDIERDADDYGRVAADTPDDLR